MKCMNMNPISKTQANMVYKLEKKFVINVDRERRRQRD